MLKLLLDEHISPAVADGLRHRIRLTVVSTMTEWEEGEFLRRQDSDCMQQAAAQGLTLVTYDRRTIPALLKVWGEEGRTHGGVIFVDEKTLSPSDIGGLVRALTSLLQKTFACTEPHPNFVDASLSRVVGRLQVQPQVPVDLKQLTPVDLASAVRRRID